MFSRPLSPCYSQKRRLVCENQPIFASRLPIKFFYFADFQWSFFGKMIGQKQPNIFTKNGKKKSSFFYKRVAYLYIFLQEYVVCHQALIITFLRSCMR